MNPEVMLPLWLIATRPRLLSVRYTHAATVNAREVSTAARAPDTCWVVPLKVSALPNLPVVVQVGVLPRVPVLVAPEESAVVLPTFSWNFQNVEGPSVLPLYVPARDLPDESAATSVAVAAADSSPR